MVSARATRTRNGYLASLNLHGGIKKSGDQRRMGSGANLQVELSPMEVERCHRIQENILRDRVVESNNVAPSFTLMESEVHLDHIGKVALTLTESSLIWQSQTAEDKVDTFSLPCFRLASLPHEFPLSEIYGVENYGLGPIKRYVGPAAIHRFLRPVVRMYRFAIHSFQRLKNDKNKWVPKSYDFAHPEREVCERWVHRLHRIITNDPKRPKDLLVLINPFGGKGIACNRWAMVSPFFSRAGIRTKVITTTRAGHAFDLLYKATDDELRRHDGVVVVGGDGIFNEVLNGLALKRHTAPVIKTPQQFSKMMNHSDEDYSSDILPDSQPLITYTSDSQRSAENFTLGDALSTCWRSEQIVPWLRFGIIPAGSTDTIVVSTTGTRDAVTAALHIIVGDSMPLDIVRLTGWKNSKEVEAPEIRYAASFAGYGFYGDVARESEELRWMGPARYDYTGTKVFMRHRKYEAQVSYLEIPDPERLVCRVDCRVCAKGFVLPENSGEWKWRTSRGLFHSVGAAVMACRNDKAPDGVLAHAHLGDGLLHLIIIKPCSRPAYLMQLLQLAKKGGNPLGFNFVEHHKTPVFAFVAHGEQSVWNVDGEIFPAGELCGQVFRGLINIFARGPEV